MKKNLNVLFLLFLFFNTAIYAQKKQGEALVDSLLAELPKANEDTNKVNTLKLVSVTLSNYNPEDGIKYGKQGLELATKMGWKKGIARMSLSLGCNYLQNPDYNSALQYFNKALKVSEEIGDKKDMASSMGNIGSVYLYQGNYPSALEYLNKALKINEDIGNKVYIGYGIEGIGAIYYHQGDFIKALEYDLKALKIYEDIGNKERIAVITTSIGNIYTNQNDYPKALEYYLKVLKISEDIGNKMSIASAIGNIGITYEAQSNYTKALEFSFKALKMNEDIGNKQNISVALQHIGTIYSDQNNYTEALEYYIKALKMNEDIGNKQGTENINFHIGVNYCRMKQYTLAIEYEQKALKMAMDIDELNDVRDYYHKLSDVYDSIGDYKKALYCSNKYHELEDSIFSKENGLKISKLEDKAEYEHKADSIKLVEDTKALAYQKELQLNALKYEYEKKQAAAKTEGEKQQLRYEEKIKSDNIKADFTQKQLILKAEQKKKEALAKVKLHEQKNYTYAGLAGIILLLGFSFFIVRERLKSEKLLLNILPTEVAKELKAKGYSDARNFDEVTVLFTDFVGFTNVSMRLTPKELVYELDMCFKAFDAIMGKHKIEKIKTVGDAYLAVCGLPKANHAHAENVVRAAQEIKDFMLNRHAQLSDKTFEVRIGVHSGNVVAGIVGVKKFAYDIWGDTVNTAARMEQNSEAGKINISETTYKLVHDKFTCTYRGEIEAKNKGMLKMYFVS